MSFFNHGGQQALVYFGVSSKEMSIQGYVKKERTFSGLQAPLRPTLDYGDNWLRPNRRFGSSVKPIQAAP